jgi:flagellar biosynthesis protein FlhF
MVQNELGPDAKVVQTRELHTRWWERFAHGRQFEIRTRRAGPSPLPLRRHGEPAPPLSQPADVNPRALPVEALEFRQRLAERVQAMPAAAEVSLEDVGERFVGVAATGQNSALFELLAELIDAEVPEATARELTEQLRSRGFAPTLDRAALRHELLHLLARDVSTTGPIPIVVGQCRVVALVGPTGVGKTTTIAKLAANFRLRDRFRVGLITVDTFRIAAVDQLRTYAEIMDLPMEVVSTPREMRAAVSRLADCDVVLIDTAGRSPHDAVQLQQLKTLLSEAGASDIQLVVSAVASLGHLRQVVANFTPLGATSLIITKLDEATGLGNLLPTLQAARLPVSYLTCGQSVPEDIVVADAQCLLPVILAHEPISSLT